MSKRSTEQPSKIVMLAPVALVLIVYGFLILMPQQSELQTKQERLDKLVEGQHDLEHELQDTRMRSVSLNKELRETDLQLKELKQQESELLAQRDRMRRQTVQPSRPAETMQRVTQLMEQHRLQVMESQPENDSGDRAAKVLGPLLNLLSDTSTQTNQSNASIMDGREVYRLTVRGRFQDLQSALSALTEQLDYVLPLSLQMESLDLESEETQLPERVWTLTIVV